MIGVGHQEGYWGENLPSLLQAATRVSKQATMATVKSDSLILVVVLRKGYTADVSALYFMELFEASNEVLALRQGCGPACFYPHRLGLTLEQRLALPCLACARRVVLFPVIEEHARPHR